MCNFFMVVGGFLMVFQLYIATLLHFVVLLRPPRLVSCYHFEYRVYR